VRGDGASPSVETNFIPQKPSMDKAVTVNHCLNWFDSSVRSQFADVWYASRSTVNEYIEDISSMSSETNCWG
jgi:hypothetical protein